MDIVALIMAGGRGLRMKLPVEKPLVKIVGKPMVEYVIDTLTKVSNIKRIIVATTPHTPRTTKRMMNLSVEVIQTPKGEYVSDIQYAVRKLKLENVLTVSADLPLITAEIIGEIIKRFKASGKSALTVCVPQYLSAKIGSRPKYTFEVDGKKVVPSGVNMINGSRIDDLSLDQEILVMDSLELAINVNTVKLLKMARNFAKY
ncbi:MAG: NTP transferase domain-containing protein [Candidatus Bathyarchaeota archaeon]